VVVALIRLVGAIFEATEGGGWLVGAAILYLVLTANYRPTWPCSGEYLLASCGSSDAQAQLGEVYYQGSKGADKDIVAAMKWFRMAADQGNTYAQFRMAWASYYGEGMQKNLAEARRWYLKAAEQGEAVAQFNLGLMYAQGEGGTKDPQEARKWYEKAAAQGHHPAREALDKLGK
jgi:TPR repeat protein